MWGRLTVIIMIMCSLSSFWLKFFRSHPLPSLGWLLLLTSYEVHYRLVRLLTSVEVNYCNLLLRRSIVAYLLPRRFIRIYSPPRRLNTAWFCGFLLPWRLITNTYFFGGWLFLNGVMASLIEDLTLAVYWVSRYTPGFLWFLVFSPMYTKPCVKGVW